MRKESEYADEPELRAIARMYGRPIHLYETDVEMKIIQTNEDEPSEGEPFRVLYTRFLEHYEAVVEDEDQQINSNSLQHLEK